MIDAAYVAGSVLFFALMLLYVKGCAHLGRTGTADLTECLEEGR